ncbi:autotransporter outer membrane beta-barrel domain-containing protein, partial [Escherichia coli]|nr:autotransporter outer membrane beta-barrel domain-containing protein [Escherichia coli]
MSDMKSAKKSLSTRAIAISTVLFTPVSLAVTPPTDANSVVIINNGEEAKVIASEGYNPGWNHFTSLNVGQNSNGSLLIDNISLITANATVGNNAEGSLTLSNHTNWQFDTPTSKLFLGTNEGSGTVYVLEGSKISGLQELRVGEYYGDAKGLMVIDGENSSVSSNITLVGDQGTGNLRITNGGTLTTSAQVAIGYAYPANDISKNRNSYGEVLVDGKNSTLNAEYVYLGGFSPDVAFNTTGILTVNNGATINANSFIWVTLAPGATGVLNIGGAQGEAEQPAGSINTPFIHLGAADASSSSVVNFNHSSADFVLASPIQGNGQVNQVGSGTTTLSGSNNYAGNTYITKG